MIEFKIDEFRNAYFFKKKKIFSIFVENLKKKKVTHAHPFKNSHNDACGVFNGGVYGRLSICDLL